MKIFTELVLILNRVFVRVVVDLARFDLLERLQAGRQYNNLYRLISKRTWYTKCISQIVSSLLDHITFRENISYHKSEVFVTKLIMWVKASE
jgi:hypothetical protein